MQIEFIEGRDNEFAPVVEVIDARPSYAEPFTLVVEGIGDTRKAVEA